MNRIAGFLLRIPEPQPGELRIVEELGPIGRRRALAATAVSTLAIIAAFAWVIRRFQLKGQFAAERWKPFTIWGVQRFLLKGVGNTLLAFGVSLVLSLGIGIVMAMWRSSTPKPKRLISTLYTEVFRACALIVLIRFFFFQFGHSFPSWKSNWKYAFAAIVVALTLYYSSVFAEVIRSSLRSLAKGQSEAGLAVGLRETQTMRLVLLPQALKRALPNLFTQAASLLKDTSLGKLITFEEIVKQSDIVGNYGENLLQSYIVAWAIYFVLVASLTSTAKRLQARSRTESS
jgi:glutamate transport system permease protein